MQEDLHEEVYMMLPHIYPSESSNLVCRLQNSLYGLKHVSRQCTLSCIMPNIQKDALHH